MLRNVERQLILYHLMSLLHDFKTSPVVEVVPWLFLLSPFFLWMDPCPDPGKGIFLFHTSTSWKLVLTKDIFWPHPLAGEPA